MLVVNKNKVLDVCGLLVVVVWCGIIEMDMFIWVVFLSIFTQNAVYCGQLFIVLVNVNLICHVKNIIYPLLLPFSCVLCLCAARPYLFAYL